MSAVIVMGVAGCGKTTVGQQLGSLLKLPFFDGDDYHGEANQKKMAAGQPLTDTDREPWLENLCELIRAHPAGCAISCSALKQKYRQQLRQAGELRFVYLEISIAAATQRVASREHFFPVSLVEDQFNVLEDPGSEPDVVPVDGELPLAELVPLISVQLNT